MIIRKLAGIASVPSAGRMTRAALAAAAALWLAACSSIPPVPDGDMSGHNGAPTASVSAQRTPPGGLNQDVTQGTILRTICIPGWTASVRPSSSYTNAVKLKLLREAGLPASDAASYELDHFVPLAVGGHPRDPNNLWLQPWDGEWGAKTKDRLERKLQKLVCAGQLSLADAQSAVRTDWIRAYKRFVTDEDVSAPAAMSNRDTAAAAAGMAHSADVVQLPVEDLP